jgi:hypothetical protein
LQEVEAKRLQAEKEMRAREDALREQKRSLQVMMAEIQRRDEEVDRKTKACEQRILNVSFRQTWEHELEAQRERE